MIDLHNHILPGVDDGPKDLHSAMEMAWQFVDDGVSIVGSTPHIQPVAYPNCGPAIQNSVSEFQAHLREVGCPLSLACGSENHVTPDFLEKLVHGQLLSLANSRYVLVEPPYHAPPPRLNVLFDQLLDAGYVPILVHPERFIWIDEYYEVLKDWALNGVWLQVTAGALCNIFGPKNTYWANRFVGEGLTHILASDAHDPSRRRSCLPAAALAAERLIGRDAARDLVETRPNGILQNRSPDELPALEALLAHPSDPARWEIDHDQRQTDCMALR